MSLREETRCDPGWPQRSDLAPGSLDVLTQALMGPWGALGRAGWEGILGESRWDHLPSVSLDRGCGLWQAVRQGQLSQWGISHAGALSFWSHRLLSLGASQRLGFVTGVKKWGSKESSGGPASPTSCSGLHCAPILASACLPSPASHCRGSLPGASPGGMQCALETGNNRQRCRERHRERGRWRETEAERVFCLPVSKKHIPGDVSRLPCRPRPPSHCCRDTWFPEGAQPAAHCRKGFKVKAWCGNQ